MCDWGWLVDLAIALVSSTAAGAAVYQWHVRQVRPPAPPAPDESWRNSSNDGHAHEFAMMRRDGLWRCLLCGVAKPKDA